MAQVQLEGLVHVWVEVKGKTEEEAMENAGEATLEDIFHGETISIYDIEDLIPVQVLLEE